ncbi:transcriptional regulator, SarA/Rot family [Macrococcus sp. 18KM445]|uniref:transcriptional regulator, SarA/Rot family n=2 Tax=Macrococcus equi TaxID=3395462 RepID=UPI0039BDC87D
MDKLKFLMHSNSVNNEIEQLITDSIKNEFDISAKDLFILEVLFNVDEMNVTEIKRKLQFISIALSVKLKTLQEKGLIIKERDIRDERIVKVRLSAEGLVTYGKVKDKIENELDIEPKMTSFIESYS